MNFEKRTGSYYTIVESSIYNSGEFWDLDFWRVEHLRHLNCLESLKMSQSDFELFALENEHQEDNSDASVDDIANGQKIEREEAEIDGKTSKESYVPVNFISDAVYEMIAAWEASSSTTSVDGMDLEFSSVPLVPASKLSIEPARHIDDFKPPKRFYKTFWSSVSKRIIASSKARIMKDVSRNHA
jgi:hypothetical protein